MVANTILEIYTQIFAWNMYGAIWDTLNGSGLALIPFVAALVNNFVDNYHDGEASRSIKELEMKGISMILVLMLCVVPYPGQPVTLSTLKYDLATPDCYPTANTTGAGNATGTGYDGSFGASSGMTVYKPVAWFFVEFLSSAITNTTIKSMSCANNYSFMLMRIGQIKITDDAIKERVSDFSSVCYKKALQRYEINPTPLATPVFPVDDIDWIGSRVFLTAANEYYDHESAYMSQQEQYGFTRQVTFRQSDNATNTGANPYCKEVWLGETGGGIPNPALGLRQILLDYIPDDAEGDILQAWKDWGSEVLTIGTVTDDVKEDLILKLILQANEANLSSKTDVDLTNNFDATDSPMSSFLDTLFTGAGWLNSTEEALKAETIAQVMKTAGPMILAMIQMIIIMAAPFVLVLGRYQLSAFIALALAYFAFEFINAIWAAVYWFDNQILDLYYSEAGTIDTLINGPLIKTLSTGATLILPSIWLTVLAFAGAGMVRTMGGGGVGSGSAAGSTGRLAGGASRRMGGLAKKGGRAGLNKMRG